jgi:glutaredoxin-like YruB-family protein
MNVTHINSKKQLDEEIAKEQKVYLLLYKSGMEQSRCAMSNLEALDLDEDTPVVLAADVNTVRDIHPVYGINSAPAMLEFESGRFKNVVKGCQRPEVLKAIFDEAIYSAQLAKEGKEPKRVTVYSTPTCSWCNTLKNYLRQNKIRFTDVDISRDPNEAQNLVARTGQQGVPQTEINGQWVVGFDQSKLNNLLEIRKSTK